MSDCTCPFCGEGFDADDLELYGDDESTETECPSCEKPVRVVSTIMVCYEAYCLDDQHAYVPVEGYEELEKCSRCDAPYRRRDGQ